MADPKLKKRLEALIKLPENALCADCRKRGPRWASANLGIFMCIECSGIHRGLGVHISFVRSVNLDTWTQKQVDFMEEWGNRRANEYYEANLPPNFPRPKEGDPIRQLEKFIRDKYEAKKFIGSSIPPRKDEVAAAPAAPKPVSNAAHVQISNGSGHAAQTQQRPVAAPVAAPAPVKQEASLLDWDDGPAPPPVPTGNPPPVPSIPAGADNSMPPNVFGGFAGAGAPQQQQQQAQTQSFDAFGNGNNGGAGGADMFAGFGAPSANQTQSPAQTQQPQQQQAPKADANSIMNLFGSGGGGGGGMGGGMQGGMGGMQQGGMGMGGMQGGMGGMGMGGNMQQQQHRGSMGGMPGGMGGMQQGGNPGQGGAGGWSFGNAGGSPGMRSQQAPQFQQQQNQGQQQAPANDPFASFGRM